MGKILTVQTSDPSLLRQYRRENQRKQGAYLWAIVILCVVLIVVIRLTVLSLDKQVKSLGGRNDGAVQASLGRLQTELATTKELALGLGEIMTTIELHPGKLWFAAKASNWELAEYELGELKETMEAAKAPNVENNRVKISNVLDSVLQTQIAQLAMATMQKNPAAFQKSNDETLSACNGCHTEAGYKFIQITRPNAPPVTNQKW